MPLPEASFGRPEALMAFAVIVVGAFLVTWVVTDLAHVRRTPYVAVLSVFVAALSAGYVVWSGVSVRDLVLVGWGWGVLGGVIVGGALAPLVRRMPSGGGAPYPSALIYLWEALVYGVAEALLLATLPILAVWHAMADAGWTEGAGRTIATGALTVGGAVVVVLVHHLGYAEFRRREARKMLAGTLFGCGLQGVAFAVTGNVLAPVLAHVILHAQLLNRRIEMPPSSLPAWRLVHLAGTESVPDPPFARVDGRARRPAD